MINKFACLALFCLWALSQVGCSLKGNMEASGSMNQNVQLSLSPELKSEVATVFDEVLGRAPSAQELASYVAMLSNGIPLAQIRQTLASGPEAIAKITALVTKLQGFSEPALISFLSQELATNTSFSGLANFL